jgi:hypothetical protein
MGRLRDGSRNRFHAATLNPLPEVLSMNDDLNWSRRGRTHMTLAIFAVIVAVAIIAAFAATIQRVDTRQTSSDMPPGTIGLAHPHPPLDRGPGEPVK